MCLARKQGLSEMLDRFLAQIALALFSYLERKIERGSTAVDADLDPDKLRRGGERLRKWLHKNDPSIGKQPDSTGR